MDIRDLDNEIIDAPDFVEDGRELWEHYRFVADKGQELLRVVRGSGSIKWARGETPFSEGDAFCADGLEEYELGGGGEFLVCKQQ